MHLTEPTNDQLLLMAIRQAQHARGCELSEVAIEQYLVAFHGTPADKIQAAFTKLFAIQDNVRAMPSPREVLDQVRITARNEISRQALPEPNLDAIDRAFATAIGPVVSMFLTKKITAEDMDRSMVKIAKQTGAYDRIKGQTGASGVIL